MATCLLIECDICKKAKISNENKIPSDWFEFSYDFTDVSKKLKTVDYVVCSFRCYLILLDRCVNQYALEHSNVKIVGEMGVKFARKLLEGINMNKVSFALDKTIERNMFEKEMLKVELDPVPVDKVEIKPESKIELLQGNKFYGYTDEQQGFFETFSGDSFSAFYKEYNDRYKDHGKLRVTIYQHFVKNNLVYLNKKLRETA